MVTAQQLYTVSGGGVRKAKKREAGIGRGRAHPRVEKETRRYVNKGIGTVNIAIIVVCNSVLTNKIVWKKSYRFGWSLRA